MSNITEDKSTWGSGPWQHEPDHKVWKDPATGLVCMAHRQMRLGHWCGYVAVPPGHPAHRAEAESLDISIHGGLNYSSECSGEICHIPEPGEPADVWWLGFDCAHSGDIAPAMEARDTERGWAPWEYATYKTLGYVEAQCQLLAQQLTALQPGAIR